MQGALMAKVYLTKESRQRAHLSAWIYGMMKTQGITQSQLADCLGIRQQSLNRKLKTQHFSYDDLVVIFKVFGASDTEKAKLLTQE